LIIRFFDHSPEYKITWKLPVDYDPKAKSDVIEKVFRQWVDPDDYEKLYQIVAQALLQSFLEPYKKSYLIQGKRDSGKSTYIKYFLTAFFGIENTGGIGLTDLGKNFEYASLENKLVNLDDELTSVGKVAADKFKSKTGSSTCTIEAKYKTPYVGRVNPVHVFGCNKPPIIKDQDDDAFWTRWELIIFPNQFKRDGTFQNRVFTPENLSSALNTVLNYVIQIHNNNELMQASNGDEIKQMWKSWTDVLYNFREDCFVQDVDGKYTADNLYIAYQNYCKKKNLAIEYTPRQLNKSLLMLGFAKCDIGGKGKQKTGFVGWKFKRDCPFAPAEKEDYEGILGFGDRDE
jgi:putative DNA primase/helicase